MSRRHIMLEVEQRGFDPTRPHRPDKAGIKIYKGAPEDQAVEVAAETPEPTVETVELRSGLVELPETPLIVSTNVDSEKDKRQKVKPKKQKRFSSVPEADE